MRLVFVLIAIFGVAAISAFSQKPTVTEGSEAESQVYEAILSEYYGSSQTKPLVIREQTENNSAFRYNREDWKKIKTQLPELLDETVRDFSITNKTTGALTASLDNLKIKYTLFRQIDYEGVFKDGSKGWVAFYKIFPESGGYFAFSRIGFNKEQNQALIYLVHLCGGTCGTGHYVLLTKNEKGWTVRSKEMMWIS